MSLAALLVGVVCVALGGAGQVEGHPPSPGPDLRTWAAVAWALTAGTPLAIALGAAVRGVRSRGRRSVEVGTDGVRYGERFIPYAELSGVEHVRTTRTPRGSRPEGGAVDPTERGARVRLELAVERKGGILLAGERIEIVTRSAGDDGPDPLGAEMVRAIEEALASWAARPTPLEVDVTRSGRTGAEWVEALRRLGAGASDSYRRAAADLEALSRLLDDPLGLPSARAAAAIVLSASGDATAPARLRLAAEGLVEPRVRVALESIAGGLRPWESLGALEAVERERAKRSAG
jgi:hypothetical protein